MCARLCMPLQGRLPSRSPAAIDTPQHLLCSYHRIRSLERCVLHYYNTYFPMRTFCTVVQPICSPGVWENRYFHIRTTRRPHGIIDYPVRLSYATRTEKKTKKHENSRCPLDLGGPPPARRHIGREAAVDVHNMDDHQDEVRRRARPSPHLARCLASLVVTAPCSPPLPLAAAPGSPPRRPTISPGRRRARLAASPA